VPAADPEDPEHPQKLNQFLISARSPPVHVLWPACHKTVYNRRSFSHLPVFQAICQRGYQSLGFAPIKAQKTTAFHERKAAMAGYRLENASRLFQSAMRGGFILVAGLTMSSLAGAALALPPNPQRAFEAQTCAEAQARHAEAEAGSPLISQAENAAVLAQAVAQMRRLCGIPSQNLEKPWNRPKPVPEGAILKGNVSCRS
jgi:hypothetical protein